MRILETLSVLFFSALLLCALCVPAVMQGQVTTKLLTSDLSSEDGFGISGAVYNDFAIVGAWEQDNVPGGINSGAVYCFHRDSSNWGQVQKLIASDAVPDGRFGRDVAILGNFAAVGAIGAVHNTVASGAVYFYQYQSGQWQFVQKLVPSDGQPGDEFGYPLEFSGDYLFVGARKNNAGGINSGAVYAFKFITGQWVEDQKLVPSDATTGDEFGSSLAMKSVEAVIGASKDNDNGPNSGSAYVYEFDGTTWNEVQKITPTDGAANEEFGSSVAISSNQMAIGARFDDDNGLESGSVYIYEDNGTSWIFRQKIYAFNPDSADRFGSQVGIANGRLVISAEKKRWNGVSSGLVQIYERPDTLWQRVRIIVPEDADTGDFFGGHVSIQKTSLLVGAFEKDDSGTGSGASYVYDLIPPENDTCMAAISLACGDTIIGTNVFATKDDSPDSCVTDLSASTGVWYSIVGTGDNVTASLCLATFDTRIAVYTAACEDTLAQCITGIDNVCGKQAVAIFSTIPGETYYIYVSGGPNAKGNFQLIVGCEPPTCAPAPVATTDQIGSTSARLNWTKVPGAIRYEITGSEVGTPLFTVSVSGWLNRLTLFDLDPGTSYTWKVRAICDMKDSLSSSFSVKQLFTTVVTCFPPSGLFADPVTHDAALLQWTPAAGASGYRIIRSKLGSADPPIGVTVSNPGADKLIVSGLEPSTTYLWTMHSFCGPDLSALTPFDTFTTLPAPPDTMPTAVGGAEFQPVRIYPNPASTEIYLQLGSMYNGKTVHLKLTNHSGRTVFEATRGMQHGLARILLPQHLASGIYHLGIITSDATHQKRFILKR